MLKDAWWRSAVFYQVVVPSFQDSNEDGIGDLRGLTRRLHYLRDLGIDALWLTPIMDTPFYDLGYDVRDFTSIYSVFGNESDFRELLDTAHRYGMRLIIDFVPNHTSNEHEWFKESRSSRENLKRDWYIWEDAGPHQKPPSNWIDRFGNSAWTYDESTHQYYLASFAPVQPDLNWRNASMRHALYSAMRRWLEFGVDGFRIDALAHLIKDCMFRDNPPAIGWNEAMPPADCLTLAFNQNQPELLSIISEMRSVMDEYPEQVFVGEVYQSPEQVAAYQNAGAQLLLTTSLSQTKFESIHIRNMIDLIEGRTAYDAWPAYCTGNHDIGRLCDRVPEEYLRSAVLLHLCVRGTPFIYFGDELGLKKTYVSTRDAKDPSGQHDERFGRDGYRTPMVWNNDKHCGFSEVDPWLPIGVEHSQFNVSRQSNDPSSLLNFVRHAISFRKRHRAIQCGTYRPIDAREPLVAFLRSSPAEELLVIFNVSHESQAFDLSEHFGGNTCAQVLFSTIFREQPKCTNHLELLPCEGIITQVKERV